MSSEKLIAQQLKKKKGRIKKPISVEQAQKKQAAKEEKLKRDSEKYLKENRKQSIEIQTPEVQRRMKQNIKDANASYKTKKKNNTSGTRKAGKKYR